MKSLKKKTITNVSGKKDLCVIHSEGEVVVSAGFVTNKMKTAPIFMNMEYIRCPITKVIVVNRNLFKGE